MSEQVSGADGSAYYRITLANGTVVECGDIIDALGMSFNRGEAFKALFRCGRKPGVTEEYDLDKGVYFTTREAARIRALQPELPLEAAGPSNAPA